MYGVVVVVVEKPCLCYFSRQGRNPGKFDVIDLCQLKGPQTFQFSGTEKITYTCRQT